jgi:hypothetical protein
MSDEIRYETVEDPEIERLEPTAIEPTGDAEKGAMLGGVGGLVAGAMAGSVTGPGGAVVGAIIGGVIGAAASGAAVAAVDKIDDDTKFSGLPDDMDFQDGPDREPTITDRSRLNREEVAPPLDSIPAASEAPLGVGMPEAIAMTEPATVSTFASADVPPPIPSNAEVASYAEPANLPIDRGGVSGDAEIPGTAPFTDTGLIDGGWDRDSDANQIDVNPAAAMPSESERRSSGYAYADNPEDDLQDRKSE